MKRHNTSSCSVIVRSLRSDMTSKRIFGVSARPANRLPAEHQIPTQRLPQTQSQSQPEPPTHSQTQSQSLPQPQRTASKRPTMDHNNEGEFEREEAGDQGASSRDSTMHDASNQSTNGSSRKTSNKHRDGAASSKTIFNRFHKHRASRVRQALARHPLLSNSLAAGTLMLTGDAICQNIERRHTGTLSAGSPQVPNSTSPHTSSTPNANLGQNANSCLPVDSQPKNCQTNENWFNIGRSRRMFFVGMVFNGPMYAWWYGGRLQAATAVVVDYLPRSFAIRPPQPPTASATKTATANTVRTTPTGVAQAVETSGSANVPRSTKNALNSANHKAGAATSSRMSNRLSLPLSAALVPSRLQPMLRVLSCTRNMKIPFISVGRAISCTGSSKGPNIGNFGFLLLCSTVDCWLFNPIYTALFFIAAEFVSMNWTPSKVLAKLQQEWFDACIIGGTLWFPVQLANFALVPRHLSAVTVNLCNLVWSIFLSSRANRRLTVTAP